MSSLTLTKATLLGEPVAVAPPTRVVLTPTEAPETSPSFSWLAGDALHTVEQVEIAPAGGGDVRTVDVYNAGVANGNLNHHFSATVRDLAPGTAYRYRVGLPGSWSGWFAFRNANLAATDFQFIYYGDAKIGLDTTWPKVVKQAEARAPRPIGSVHAGDLIDKAGNKTQRLNWFTGMEDSPVPVNVMATPGNHEYPADRLLNTWKANFEYPHNNPSTNLVGELAALAQGDSDEARQFITLNMTRDITFLTPQELLSCTGLECQSNQNAVAWTRF